MRNGYSFDIILIVDNNLDPMKKLIKINKDKEVRANQLQCMIKKHCRMDTRI